MTIAQAGDYYLGWICWSNQAGDYYSKKTDGRSYQTLTQKTYRDLARKVARIERVTAEALDSPPLAWPAEVTRPAHGVAIELLLAVDAYNRLADARTWQAASSAWGALSRIKSEHAQVVRMRLGLPSANSRRDGCDGRGDRPLAP